MKPSDSSGSKGISIVDGPDGLEPAFAVAAGFSHGGEVIVEEYIDGLHLSAECLIADHEPSFMAVIERTITPPPHVVTLEQIMPAEIPAATVAELGRLVAHICCALDLDRGPLNLDLVVARSGELHLIEMAARPGGNGISRLVQDVYGVNLPEVAIKIALGQPVDVGPRPGRIGCCGSCRLPDRGSSPQIPASRPSAHCPRRSSSSCSRALARGCDRTRSRQTRSATSRSPGPLRARRARRSSARSRSCASRSLHHRRVSHACSARQLPFLNVSAATLASAALVWMLAPHGQDLGSVWVLLAKLVPFVSPLEAIALLDVELVRRLKLGLLVMAATVHGLPRLLRAADLLPVRTGARSRICTSS